MDENYEPLCEDEEEDGDYVPSDGSGDKGESSESECDDELLTVEKKEISADSQSEKLNETDLKQKADELWADLCKESIRSKRVTNITNTNSTNSGINVKEVECEIKKKTDSVARVFEFAGEEVKVPQEVQIECKGEKTEKANKSETSNSSSNKRSGSGLSGLLANINKKPKLSTLTKSKLDWQSYKKYEGFEEELSQHRSSKDNFVERQAFLQRADLREFENEKSIREKNRIRK